MKDHRLAVGRVFLLAALLALVPSPAASHGEALALDTPCPVRDTQVPSGEVRMEPG